MTNPLTECLDHDKGCAVILRQRGCLQCWMRAPHRGYCPYLQPDDAEPIEMEEMEEVTA